MGKGISLQTRNELLGAIQRRYQESSKTDKVRILDEFIALTGYHRKHGIRLLSKACNIGVDAVRDVCVGGRRAYDEAVKEALIVMWEASDRICGKCLKAIIPELLDAMERHGYLDLDPEVKRRVLRVSTATIDRLLKPIRSGAKSRRKWRRPKKVSKEVPVRGLGPARSWLLGNGFRCSLWSIHGRLFHPHTCHDGRVFRLDRIANA